VRARRGDASSVASSNGFGNSMPVLLTDVQPTEVGDRSADDFCRNPTE
jgi:hypothetical protein